MVGGPAQQKPGVKNVYWSDVDEVEDDVVEEVHLEVWLRNMIILPPLMCKTFKMSEADG